MQLAGLILDTGAAYEGMSFRSDDLGESLNAIREKRKPRRAQRSDPQGEAHDGPSSPSSEAARQSSRDRPHRSMTNR